MQNHTTLLVIGAHKCTTTKKISLMNEGCVPLTMSVLEGNSYYHSARFKMFTVWTYQLLPWMYFARWVTLALDKNTPFSQRSACKHDQDLIMFCIFQMWSCILNNLTLSNLSCKELKSLWIQPTPQLFKTSPSRAVIYPVHKLSLLSYLPPSFHVLLLLSSPSFPPSLSLPGEAFLFALSEITQFFQEETLETIGNQERGRGEEESVCVNESPPSK